LGRSTKRYIAPSITRGVFPLGVEGGMYAYIPNAVQVSRPGQRQSVILYCIYLMIYPRESCVDFRMIIIYSKYTKSAVLKVENQTLCDRIIFVGTRGSAAVQQFDIILYHAQYILLWSFLGRVAMWHTIIIGIAIYSTRYFMDLWMSGLNIYVYTSPYHISWYYLDPRRKLRLSSVFSSVLYIIFLCREYVEWNVCNSNFRVRYDWISFRIGIYITSGVSAAANSIKIG